MTDEFPPALDHVHRLLGRCLLAAQHYEMLLKAIIAAQRLGVPDGDVEKARAGRAALWDRSTLGMLVAELTGSLLVPPGRSADPAGDAGFAYAFSITLPPEDHARIEADLRALVDLRNRLVHHFLTEHDLRTEVGCQSAQAALTTTLARIKTATAGLFEWAGDMDRAKEAFRDYLASSTFEDFYLRGVIPWPQTGIVHALQGAAKAIAVDGWASVDGAAAWMAQHYPEETPAGYGRSTWRQVIHDSGLFDLQTRAAGGKGAARYRPKPQVPALPDPPQAGVAPFPCPKNP